MRRALLLFLGFIFSFCALAQDSTAIYKIASVNFEGNKVSHPSILYREMTLEVGDSLTPKIIGERLGRSKNNLRSLNIFNFVEIGSTYSDSTVDILITLVERWYIIPEPILEYADRNLAEWISTGWKLDRLDYGLAIHWSNFRGRNETLILLAQFGYNNRFGFQYRFPYLDKQKKIGLDLEFSFTRNHEIAYSVSDNRRVFYKDPDQFSRIEYFASTNIILRPQLYNRHEFGLEYTDANVADSVAIFNPNYFRPGKSNTRYFSLSYSIFRDLRDYNSYPLTGYLFTATIRKDGLGIFNSAVDMLDIHATYNKFWKLHKRWFIAAGIKAKASPLNTQAYFTQRGLGYETDFVRGYELYVIDGQYYGLAKSDLRFLALPPIKINLKFLKSDKFGLIPLAIYTNLHVDAGYVVDNKFEAGNPLSNRFIFGGGVGVDLITYYDVVWRLEYSMNDRLEHGFFIHFTKHI